MARMQPNCSAALKVTFRLCVYCFKINLGMMYIAFDQGSDTDIIDAAFRHFFGHFGLIWAKKGLL